MSENPFRLNIEQIKRYLPHRHPFLMIDKVLEIHPTPGDPRDFSSGKDKIGIRVVAIKNVTYNEPCFQGHFPNFSLFPGVLIIEAMAQTTSFTLYPYLQHDIDRLSRDFRCVLVGVDSVRFRKPVLPGETLRIESVVTKCKSNLWGFKVVASVDGQRVAEAEIMANLIVAKGDKI
ncbi:MAG: 3-hydroxyacyl-[acyl-carrier-protein] dehydratase FabZ [Bdellovibrionales bacterium RIFOXYD1_FULL_44_7]|nr:MAG: 3-hydroxyacyl-[acyl-carrier-protein] dehydratase FabZ [Bdellovibrionales bacterium RIFOXYD1_FULL_44_7]